MLTKLKLRAAKITCVRLMKMDVFKHFQHLARKHLTTWFEQSTIHHKCFLDALTHLIFFIKNGYSIPRHLKWESVYCKKSVLFNLFKIQLQVRKQAFLHVKPKHTDRLLQVYKDGKLHMTLLRQGKAYFAHSVHFSVTFMVTG